MGGPTPSEAADDERGVGGDVGVRCDSTLTSNSRSESVAGPRPSRSRPRGTGRRTIVVQTPTSDMNLILLRALVGAWVGRVLGRWVEPPRSSGRRYRGPLSGQLRAMATR